MTCPYCADKPHPCPECVASRGDPDAGIDDVTEWAENVSADGGLEYGDDLLGESLSAESVFHAIGDGKVSIDDPIEGEDRIDVTARVLRDAVEIAIDFEYIGYECRHVLQLDAETTRELIDALAPAVGMEVA